MIDLADKNVLVIGLGVSGQAACKLLLRRGAKVTAVDSSHSSQLNRGAEELRSLGATVMLGASSAPAGKFDLAALSPGISTQSLLVREISERGVPVIGELELGYQQSYCLNIAVTGTNGKTTTTELIARVLALCHRKTMAAGNIGLPITAVADETRDLDFLTLEVSSFQLETIQYFRPAVALLLNITPDHLDRYAGMEAYARAKAKIFSNQQAFDWAIIQVEALERLRALGVSIPSKVITFSAQRQDADIYFDRGLLISRMEGWSGPLLDMDSCQIKGPHNAENLMAVLAVGKVLRLPLEEVTAALKSYPPAPHRCEFVASCGGVRFINDSKATNVDAVAKALLAVPAPAHGEKNVLLIAGGKDKGFEYHDVGPLLARRVKQAFLLGETREKIRAAWSLFTPCALVDSLLEAVSKAAETAAPGDVVLLSPACSSFDMFQNYQHRGDVFRQAVRQWIKNRALAGAAAGASGPERRRENEAIYSDQ